MSDQTPPSALSGQRADASAPRASQGVTDAIAELELKIAFSSYIRELVDQVGPEIFAQPDRFRAFLMDKFPKRRVEIRMLHLAAAEQIADALLQARKSDTDIEPKRQFHRLLEQGIAPERAAWAINVLTRALGNTSEITNTGSAVAKPVAAAVVVADTPPSVREGGGTTIEPPEPAPTMPEAASPTKERMKVVLTVGALAALFAVAIALNIKPPSYQQQPPPKKQEATQVPKEVPKQQTGGGFNPFTVPPPPTSSVKTHVAKRKWTSWEKPKGDTACTKNYDDIVVTVRDGNISFVSDGYQWNGTIDANGWVNIRQSEQNLTITGYHWNATMNGQNICRVGTFSFPR
jgi:hypothetical protein